MHNAFKKEKEEGADEEEEEEEEVVGAFKMDGFGGGVGRPVNLI